MADGVTLTYLWWFDTKLFMYRGFHLFLMDRRIKKVMEIVVINSNYIWYSQQSIFQFITLTMLRTFC